MKDASEFQQDFVKLLKTMSREQGMDELLSSIFAMCYIEPEPIAMEEISHRTGYSLASVCNKVKMLDGIGMVARSSQPGTRKVFLYMEKDIKGMFRGLLLKKVTVLSRLKEKMPEILLKAKTEPDKRKVQIVEDYFNQATKFLKIYQEIFQKVEEI